MQHNTSRFSSKVYNKIAPLSWQRDIDDSAHFSNYRLEMRNRTGTVYVRVLNPVLCHGISQSIELICTPCGYTASSVLEIRWYGSKGVLFLALRSTRSVPYQPGTSVKSARNHYPEPWLLRTLSLHCDTCTQKAEQPATWPVLESSSASNDTTWFNSPSRLK